MKTIKVAVLAFNGVSLFHLSVPGIVFGVNPVPTGLPPYEVFYCAPEPGRITCDQGMEIDVPSCLDAMADADIVVAPSWKHPEIIAPVALTDALRKAHAGGAQIVGLSLGTFVLGDAGLLDGRQATTHWAYRELFARRFPASKFHPDVLYLRDGNITTSAGTVAAIDCCLNIVRERHGAGVANRVARLLVTPPHRQGGQAQYIEKPVPQLPGEGRLSGVMDWAREHLAEPILVDELADAARMSRRNFTRRFREVTGTTVKKWLTAERISKAQQLLETTELSIEQIAMEVGFGTSQSLRQHFTVQMHVSPSFYRSAFNNGQLATL
ncbi:helix-turn-helix domain-containing protein [Pectobacterium punjabense]|uniref:Helix-turn-helix domain-containing protein n=1 Tax=Pectobacterium punjabense TaxID=2108399 RepID=A0ABX6KYH6_9GAMM|nr:helix-turn-helix domain-containing protein [Pectobacterium punjabense]MBS4430651.1 helix-turn-helix domain-containing protein [Pectobacterium punjabense]PTA64056.1 AraC family transcriptional regulator [Pectobacterium punjabense]QJA18857.1 helix-turn-helix domain-containing protein [Pectobacterium punjabense]